MNTVIIILIALVCLYAICGIIAYGIEFACCQREFPHRAKVDYWSDMAGSIIVGLIWPIFIPELCGSIKTTGIKFI